MLVLSRKVGERVLIGENIAVTVVKLTHGGVRIGIEAPPEMAVIREELAKKMAAEESAVSARTTHTPIKRSPHRESVISRRA